MQFIKPDINIDFIGKRYFAYAISAIFILIAVFSLVAHGGPKYGIDFAGGTEITVQFDTATSTADVRGMLTQVGLTRAVIQRFGDADENEFRIRLDLVQEEEGTSSSVQDLIQDALGSGVQILSVEMVGPQVGADLRGKAMSAMFYALLFISIYISGRFEMKWAEAAIIAAAILGVTFALGRVGVPLAWLAVIALATAMAGFYFLQLKYAMGAIVALIHDVVITVGLFSILDIEFNLPIIAALLTIIGYSLNDTIIVFDRIRENNKRYARKPLELILNRSINETLSRTILT
ncbi:MAG: protein translocase subunit SecF, partial [Desulfatibacillaceae bacterium]|nr:protein translocase subunit SecF [Desulfatibacillaceae bacterium]